MRLMGTAADGKRPNKDSTRCQAWILLRTDNAAAAQAIEGGWRKAGGDRMSVRAAWQDGAEVLRRDSKDGDDGKARKRCPDGGCGEAR